MTATRLHAQDANHPKYLWRTTERLSPKILVERNWAAEEERQKRNARWAAEREARRKQEGEILEMNRQLLDQLKEETAYIIWPTHSRVQDWELVLFVALFYTFLMTPFQVAFLQSTPLTIFILNRIVDVLLCIDMGLVFFIAVEVESEAGRKKWETSLSNIRLRYFKTFFLLDFAGLLSSAVELMEYTKTSMAGAGPAKALRILRVIRLVRILRMARLASVMGDVQQILEDMLGSKEMKFVTVEIVKWFFKVFLVAHVMACVWGFVMSIEEGGDGPDISWLTHYETLSGLTLDRNEDVGWIYMLSLYWAFTTLVTVGYGDIIPWTLAEHLVAIAIFAMGGIIWPMMMGNICSVVGALDAERLQFGLDMDDLVAICKDRKLPQDLREKLRMYMARKWKLKRINDQQELMQSFSPALRGEVALSVSKDFLAKVEFLVLPESMDKKYRSLHRRLAEQLEMYAIPPEEWVVPADLEQYVTTVRILSNEVSHGSTHDVGDRNALSPLSADDTETQFVIQGKLPRSRNLVAPLTFMDGGVAVLDFVRLAPCHWHEDMILSSPIFRNPQVARAVVFCTIYVLRHEMLLSALQDGFYGEVEVQVRSRTYKLALCRLMSDALKAYKEAEEQRKEAQSAGTVPASSAPLTLVEAVDKVVSGTEEDSKVNTAVVSKAHKLVIQSVVQKVVTDKTPREKSPTLQTIQQMLRDLNANQAALEHKLLGHTLDS